MAKNMEPEEIKTLIKTAKTTPTALSRDLSISRQAVFMVINGKSVIYDVMEHIALAIRLPAETIWPENYPRRKPGRPKTHGLYNNEAA